MGRYSLTLPTILLCINSAWAAEVPNPDLPIPPLAVAEPASGYTVRNTNVDSIRENTWQNYSVEITRRYAGKDTVPLLNKAEELYPPREAVLAAMKTAHFKLPETETSALTRTQDALWWYSSFDGVRMPYALTNGAVNYYLELMRSFMKGDFSGSSKIAMTTASLKYTAAVTKHEVWKFQGREFRDATVVEMKLDWSQYCGSLCAMGFTKHRFVVFDKAGNVKAVIGDGPTGGVVS